MPTLVLAITQRSQATVPRGAEQHMIAPDISSLCCGCLSGLKQRPRDPPSTKESRAAIQIIPHFVAAAWPRRPSSPAGGWHRCRRRSRRGSIRETESGRANADRLVSHSTILGLRLGVLNVRFSRRMFLDGIENFAQVNYLDTIHP